MTLLVRRGMRHWLESPEPAAGAAGPDRPRERTGARGATVAALASMFISTIGGA